jgi:methylated-DNA-[protein]-cysteine S-methyltransferase
MISRQPTEFESKVYDLCRQIPQGRFSTYGSIAKKLSTAPRAVGQALKRNPFAPVVPCHRVVATNYSLGGFYGNLNNPKKVEMLEDEGIEITNGFIDRKDRPKLYLFQD